MVTGRKAEEDRTRGRYTLQRATCPSQTLPPKGSMTLKIVTASQGGTEPLKHEPVEYLLESSFNSNLLNLILHLQSWEIKVPTSLD